MSSEHKKKVNSNVRETQDRLEIERNVDISEHFYATFVESVELIDCVDETVICSTKYQESLRKNIDVLKELTKAINELGLLSTVPSNLMNQNGRENEHLVSTDPGSYFGSYSKLDSFLETSSKVKSSIQENIRYIRDLHAIEYLLISALLGLLHLKIKDYDRLKLLQIVNVYLQNFVDKCKLFGILNTDGTLQPNLDLWSCKSEDYYQQQTYNHQRYIMQEQIRKLKVILDIVKRNHSNCYETLKVIKEKSEPSSVLQLKACITPEDLDKESPFPPSVRTFDDFVLSKYGREYWKRKLLLERRMKEMTLEETLCPEENNIAPIAANHEELHRKKENQSKYFQDQIKDNLMHKLELGIQSLSDLDELRDEEECSKNASELTNENFNLKRVNSTTNFQDQLKEDLMRRLKIGAKKCLDDITPEEYCSENVSNLTDYENRLKNIQEQFKEDLLHKLEWGAKSWSDLGEVNHEDVFSEMAVKVQDVSEADIFPSDKYQLSELLGSKQFITMFAYKCLEQLKINHIEIEIIQRFLNEAFRPHYIEFLQNVTNLHQDDSLYVPELLKIV